MCPKKTHINLHFREKNEMKNGRLVQLPLCGRVSLHVLVISGDVAEGLFVEEVSGRR